MANPSARPPLRTRFRRLVESYTPDGAAGRIGFGAVAGPVGVYALVLAFGFLVNPWIGSLLVVPTAAVVGIFLTTTTLLTLWPVYLSAIDRIESPAAYSRERGTEPEPTEPSPMERLKTSYQRGELTEAAFEREVEALLENPERSPTERSSVGRGTDHTDRERRELERERREPERER